MTDFLLNDSDLLIINNDFVLGESTLQHQQLLLQSNKGDWKENPLAGVSVLSWLKDDNEAGLLSEIKQEFEKDGMKVNKLQLLNGKIEIDAYYST